MTGKVLCDVILLNMAVGCHGIHGMLHFGAACYTAKVCHVRAVLRGLSTSCQHHRMVWEGAFKVHDVQPLHHRQGHLSLNLDCSKPHSCWP